MKIPTTFRGWEIDATDDRDELIEQVWDVLEATTYNNDDEKLYTDDGERNVADLFAEATRIVDRWLETDDERQARKVDIGLDMIRAHRDATS